VFVWLLWTVILNWRPLTKEVVVTFVTFKKSSIFTLSLPVTILKESIKSSLIRLFSNVVNLNAFRRSVLGSVYILQPLQSYQLRSSPLY